MMQSLLRLSPGKYPSVLTNPPLLISESYFVVARSWFSIALPGKFSADLLITVLRV